MELTPATLEDRPAFMNLSEYYSYDFSEMIGLDVGEGGRFGDKHFIRHFEDPVCHPFLIRVEGHLAGFAIHEGRSRLTGELGVNDVAEFFVMRKYRKLAVGERAAFALFDRFNGPWEVRQVTANASATAFWNKVVHRYTRGRYQQDAWSVSHGQGVVQRFRTPVE